VVSTRVPSGVTATYFGTLPTGTTPSIARLVVLIRYRKLLE
jgi:hypothetical protein